MKKMTALLLSLVVLLSALTGVSFVSLAETDRSEPVYAEVLQTGDTLVMGAYPQSLVTDAAIIETLDAMPCTLTDYGYMQSSNASTHSYTPVDMAYADLTYGGQQYRKVVLNEYRPFRTNYASGDAYTMQDENGYEIGNTCYFLWEPLEWQVLRKETGGIYVVAKQAIDAQSYHNYNEATTWENSSLRSWLNDTFYQTAFTAPEQSKMNTLLLTNENNPSYGTNGGNATSDKLWVPSYTDAVNTAYGFSGDAAAYDTARRLTGTDYARCQGLEVSSASAYSGMSYWWLRTPGATLRTAMAASFNGSMNYYNYAVCNPSKGIRPAFKLNVGAEICYTRHRALISHQYDIIDTEPSTPYTHGVRYTTCSVCGAYYSEELPYDSDQSALVALLAKAETLGETDYSPASYAALQQACEEGSAVASGDSSQTEIDAAAAQLLSAVNALEPYLDLRIEADSGAVTVMANGATSSDMEGTFLYGTEITLHAAAAEGYSFLGWYELTTKRIFSELADYTFRITSNLHFRALFAKSEAATLTFATENGWVAKTVSRTPAEWTDTATLADILPEVPYRLGYENGRWDYNESDVLALLRTGQNAVVMPQYDQSALSPVEQEAPTAESAPSLTLGYTYDAMADVGSFTVKTAVPQDCSVNSVGVAFRFGNKKRFDPNAYFLTLNNKSTVSQFLTLSADNTYIVNTKKISLFSWAAVGYITYYDADNHLKTVYSEQINIVETQRQS